MGKFELIELQNALEVVNNQVKKLEKNLKFYENISNQLATGMLDKNIKNLDDFEVIKVEGNPFDYELKSKKTKQGFIKIEEE